MWKLTIYQMKQYSTFESEQEVSYESPCLELLTAMVTTMKKLDTSKKTRYEIKEVVE